MEMGVSLSSTNCSRPQQAGFNGYCDSGEPEEAGMGHSTDVQGNFLSMRSCSRT
jgi:hypothetical protein